MASYTEKPTGALNSFCVLFGVNILNVSENKAEMWNEGRAKWRWSLKQFH